MKQKWIRVMTGVAVGLLIAQAGFAAEVTPNQPANPASAEQAQAIKTRKEAISYSLGVETVKNYKRLGMDVDIDFVVKGMKDVISGNKLLMTDNDITNFLIGFRSELMAKVRGERMVAGQDNKKEGEKFLAENKTKEGVIALPSGLQYKVLKAGQGKIPTKDDTVEVHYRGNLINGTQFANTHEAGQPEMIRVSDGGVIAGLREALKLMAVGSKWQLFVPPKLAYLSVGKNPLIGPNATLIYEVELIAVQEPGKAGQ